MTYKDFTKMPLWSRSFDLEIEYYQLMKSFPSEDRLGMITDIKRASNALTKNIAEGFGRFEKRDKSNFYKIARGSAYELISQTMVCQRLKYIDDPIAESLIGKLKTIIEELDTMIISLDK